MINSQTVMAEVAKLREFVCKQTQGMEMLIREIAVLKQALIGEIVNREASEKAAQYWEDRFDDATKIGSQVVANG